MSEKTYTAREIANLTGLTFENVRVRLHRLGIEPVEQRYGRNFYSQEQLERVRGNK